MGGNLNLKTTIGLYANRAAPPGMRPALAAKIMRTIQDVRFAAKAGRAPGEKPRALKGDGWRRVASSGWIFRVFLWLKRLDFVCAF